ncbi:MAG: glycosyltransferase family 2 protein [Flavobacteriales bacterium]|nr:glycosyltransferase family 2 protein [Flavobacteriales bacterium]
MNALVSIITPTFNSAKYIAETIQSVQNQTYSNWEMIIVDDASSDETVQIIESYSKKDVRIKNIIFEDNKGAGIARDTAVKISKGKYIAFLDADDIWKVNKLEKQLNFMKKNELYFTFSFYECIDEDGVLLNKLIQCPQNLSYRQLYFCNYVGNLTGIYDVDFFGKISISHVRKRQDWIMWLTILKKIKIAYPVQESLALYRIRKNSISSSKLDLIKYNYKVYREHHNCNVFVAIISIIIFLFIQLFVKPSYIKKSSES